MRIKVPVTIEVEVDFDTEVDGVDAIQEIDRTAIERKSKDAIAECLHQNAGMGLADDMVEYITDETGWCINGLYMEVK